MDDFNKSLKNYSKDIKTGATNFQFFGFVGKVMLFLLLCLIVFSFVRKAYSGNPITFTSFLEWCSSLNTFQIQVSIQNFVISADWGLFNFFRDFLNIFTSLIGVGVWLSANFYNFIFYCLQFLRFIFV